MYIYMQYLYIICNLVFSAFPVMGMLLFSLPVLTPTRWISHLMVAPPSVLSVSSSPSSLLWTCYFVACLFHPSLAVRLRVLPPARCRDMLWVVIWAAPSQTLPPPLCEWRTFMTRNEKLKTVVPLSHLISNFDIKAPQSSCHPLSNWFVLIGTEREKNHDGRTKWRTFLHLKLRWTLSDICWRPSDLRTLHLALVIISFHIIAFTYCYIFYHFYKTILMPIHHLCMNICLALSEESFWTDFVY